MRISDWSSDVCSSDLGADGEQALARPLLAAGDRELAGRMAHVEQLAVVPRGCRLQHRHVGKAVVQAGGEIVAEQQRPLEHGRSEEHTSELPSLMRTSYAVFCL